MKRSLNKEKSLVLGGGGYYYRRISLKTSSCQKIDLEKNKTAMIHTGWMKKSHGMA